MRKIYFNMLCIVGMIWGSCSPAWPYDTLRCTQFGTTGADLITVSLSPGQIKVICPRDGADIVEITAFPDNPDPANTRLIIAKGKGSLNVDWNAGSKKVLNTSFMIIRPITTPVALSQGADPNLNLPPNGASAVCGINQAYKVATEPGDFISFGDGTTGGTAVWYGDPSPKTQDLGC